MRWSDPLQSLGNRLLALKRGRQYDFTFLDEHEAMRRLLVHAARHVPYYARLLAEQGVVDGDAVNMDHFAGLPTLTKDILKERFDDLTSDDISSRSWHHNASGGSTGTPTKYIQDAAYDLYKEKTFHHFCRQMLAMDYFQARKLILWGSQRDILKQKEGPRSRLIKWMENQMLFDCFHISDEDLQDFVSALQCFRPQIVRGYAVGVFELAEYILKHQLKVPPPRFVVSQAENLTPSMHAAIGRAFGCPVRNFYGGREVSAIAGEGDDGLLHIFSFWNYVEVLDEHNRPVREGEEGKVAVTTLYNHAMPMIRYEIGDRAVRGPMSERYGYPHPTLAALKGREVENFVRRDGTVVSAIFFIHFISVVFNDGKIEKYQVIQEDYDRIRIRFVSGEDLSSGIKGGIEENIHRVMGNDCRVVWERTVDIPKTAEGKFLYVQSLVKRGARV